MKLLMIKYNTAAAHQYMVPTGKMNMETASGMSVNVHFSARWIKGRSRSSRIMDSIFRFNQEYEAGLVNCGSVRVVGKDFIHFVLCARNLAKVAKSGETWGSCSGKYG